MKINVKTLMTPHKVHFDQQERWTQQIVRDLSPGKPSDTNLNGELTLKSDSAGFIHVSGSVKAQATLPCDRCGRDVIIPIVSDIVATYRPPYLEHAPREMALSTEDLDVYFIEDGHVDLEVLINDTLQFAVPNHILCQESDSDGCAGGDQDSDLVYSDQVDDNSQSPFAVLRDLKKS